MIKQVWIQMSSSRREPQEAASVALVSIPSARASGRSLQDLSRLRVDQRRALKKSSKNLNPSSLWEETLKINKEGPQREEQKEKISMLALR